MYTLGSFPRRISPLCKLNPAKSNTGKSISNPSIIGNQSASGIAINVGTRKSSYSAIKQNTNQEFASTQHSLTSSFGGVSGPLGKPCGIDRRRPKRYGHRRHGGARQASCKHSRPPSSQPLEKNIIHGNFCIII